MANGIKLFLSFFISSLWYLELNLVIHSNSWRQLIYIYYQIQSLNFIGVTRIWVRGYLHIGMSQSQVHHQIPYHTIGNSMWKLKTQSTLHSSEAAQHVGKCPIPGVQLIQASVRQLYWPLLFYTPGFFNFCSYIWVLLCLSLQWRLSGLPETLPGN